MTSEQESELRFAAPSWLVALLWAFAGSIITMAFFLGAGWNQMKVNTLRLDALDRESNPAEIRALKSEVSGLRDLLLAHMRGQANDGR